MDSLEEDEFIRSTAAKVPTNPSQISEYFMLEDHECVDATHLDTLKYYRRRQIENEINISINDDDTQIFSELPEELLYKIIDYLPVVDRAQLALVSKDVRQIVYNHMESNGQKGISCPQE